MAITGAEGVSDRRPTQELPLVRRYEAAGFRAWPATTVHYDGAWVVRLTPGHPAKRLNSVNPLDPGDISDIPARIERARQHFDAHGRPLTFRMSPLSGSILSRHLDSQGWDVFSDSLVMRLSLDQAEVDGAIDQIPLKDVGRFMEAALKVHRLDAALKSGLSAVVGAIRPETGMFVHEVGGEPVATAICVHDGDLAGLFEIATGESVRGRGYGRRIILSALKWARIRGAREAWLQVEAANETARRIYDSIGFRELYRYHYRRPPGA